MTPPDTDSISSFSLSHSFSSQVSRHGDAAATPPEDAEGYFPALGTSDSDVDGLAQWGTLDKIPAIVSDDTAAQKQDLRNTEYPCRTPVKPFHRWMRTLHKRAQRRYEALGGGEVLPPYLLDADCGSSLDGSIHHGQSSSGSSFRFVAAVRSASISLTSASVLTRSRRNTHLSVRGYPRTDRSSRASVSGTRHSEDSFCLDRQVSADPAVVERALQRRRILEELISTEESYIGDVRFLMNVRVCVCAKSYVVSRSLTTQVYVTMLASLPTLPAGLRSSINRNLTDIVELHEEILGELHRAVPHSEYTQVDILPQQVPPAPAVRGHHRWRSLDAVPEDKDGVSWLRDVPGVLADPQTGAEVAKIFSKKVGPQTLTEAVSAYIRR